MLTNEVKLHPAGRGRPGKARKAPAADRVPVPAPAVDSPAVDLERTYRPPEPAAWLREYYRASRLLKVRVSTLADDCGATNEAMFAGLQAAGFRVIDLGGVLLAYVLPSRGGDLTFTSTYYDSLTKSRKRT